MATSLSQISNEDILGGIKVSQEVNLVKLQGTIKKEAILDYLPMRKAKDKELLFKVILAAIVWFIEGFKEGARMRTSDILKFGYFLYEYQLDSIEDVILCFRMAESGELLDLETGGKIKRYATMDIELLKKYWFSYLDFKASLREERQRDEKQRLTGGDYRTEEDTQLIKQEQRVAFVKEFRSATNQVGNWKNREDKDLTPIQAAVKHKFKELVTKDT